MVLSETQMKYLALAWECFENPNPKVDLEKFHKLAGLASVNSARELLRVTKIKLKAEYGYLSTEVTTANANRAGGTPRSTPKKSNIAASGKGTPRKTPASSTPGKKRGRKAVGEIADRTKVGGNADADADAEGDDDEEVLSGVGVSEAGSPSKKAKTYGAAAKVKREVAHEAVVEVVGSGGEDDFFD